MQVWLGNRRVGEAKLSPRPGQGEITVHLMDDIDLSPISLPGAITSSAAVPMLKTRTMRLKLGKLRFAISERDEMLHGPRYTAEIFSQHGVLPSDCEWWQDHAEMKKVYQFTVIKVNKDQLEEIFDFDWFEPSDGGEPDRDYFERRREEMMNGHFGL